MKVLVLGGCGFIGSYVVDQLLVLGHSVRVFDRHAERFRSPLEQVEYLFGDFNDRMAVAEAVTDSDIILHLISTSLPATANLAPMADIESNLIGTISLLDTMVALRVRRIIFLSSGGTVYGVPDAVPIQETHPLRPINSYGIVKAAIENYLDMYSRMHGLSTLCVRASNTYGPRQGHIGVQGVVSTFLRKLQQGKPIEVWGDGSVVRDYLYVGDLAKLCALASDSDQTGAVNAGTGLGLSVSEIISEIEAITGIQMRPIYRPGRAIDVPCSILDVSRASRDFAWTASTSFRDGLSNTWHWIKQTKE